MPRGVFPEVCASMTDTPGLSRDAFDAVYGSSAGAINATYFLSGQRDGVNIYREDIANDRFVCLRRLVPRRGEQPQSAPVSPHSVIFCLLFCGAWSRAAASSPKVSFPDLCCSYDHAHWPWGSLLSCKMLHECPAPTTSCSVSQCQTLCRGLCVVVHFHI